MLWLCYCPLIFFSQLCCRAWHYWLATFSSPFSQWWQASYVRGWSPNCPWFKVEEAVTLYTAAFYQERASTHRGWPSCWRCCYLAEPAERVTMRFAISQSGRNNTALAVGTTLEQTWRLWKWKQNISNSYQYTMCMWGKPTDRKADRKRRADRQTNRQRQNGQTETDSDPCDHEEFSVVTRRPGLQKSATMYRIEFCYLFKTLYHHVLARGRWHFVWAYNETLTRPRHHSLSSINRLTLPSAGQLTVTLTSL